MIIKLPADSFVRKASIIFKKRGEKPQRYHFTPKRGITLLSRHKLLINKGYRATIEVFYKDGAENRGTYETVEDLQWAISAFIIEYLNG